MKLLILILATCSAVNGHDLAGKWVGTAETIDASGVKRHMEQTIEIKGSGNSNKDLTVSQLSTKGTPIPLKIVLDDAGPRFTLLRELDFEGGEHIRWHLEWKDGRLTGTIWSVHDAPKKWGVDWSGPIEFTKVAQ